MAARLASPWYKDFMYRTVSSGDALTAKDRLQVEFEERAARWIMPLDNGNQSKRIYDPYRAACSASPGIVPDLDRGHFGLFKPFQWQASHCTRWWWLIRSSA
eukprot:scaffold43322_cov28-Tisochrysis_lutea.AAC.14